MAREFNVSTGGTTVLSASVTLLYLRAAAAPSINVEVLRWWIGQSANATSAQQRVHITQRGTTFPTLVAATPVTLKMQDVTASVLVGSTTGAAGTSGINASAEGGSATYPAFILEDTFNVLNGWLHVPTPPETIFAPAGHGTGICMRFPVAASPTTSWSFGVNFREV